MAAQVLHRERSDERPAWRARRRDDHAPAPRPHRPPEPPRVDRGSGVDSGLGWLQLIAEHYPKAIWLNPETPRYWEQGTCDVVRKVFPMYHLTVEGLGEAVQHLSRKI